MGDNIETKKHWSEAVGICKVEFATVVIYDRSRIGYRFCGDGSAIWLIDFDADVEVDIFLDLMGLHYAFRHLRFKLCHHYHYFYSYYDSSRDVFFHSYMVTTSVLKLAYPGTNLSFSVLGILLPRSTGAKVTTVSTQRYVEIRETHGQSMRMVKRMQQPSFLKTDMDSPSWIYDAWCWRFSETEMSSLSLHHMLLRPRSVIYKHLTSRKILISYPIVNLSPMPFQGLHSLHLWPYRNDALSWCGQSHHSTRLYRLPTNFPTCVKTSNYTSKSWPSLRTSSLILESL